MNTDGNLYALNKRLAEDEEYDRYQAMLDADQERYALEDRVEELEATIAELKGQDDE